MADVKSIYGNPVCDEFARQKIKLLEENETQSGNGLTDDMIKALWNIVKLKAYSVPDVSEEITEFRRAFGLATLESISATYTGGNVEAGTLTENLTGLTVAATYSDNTTETVSLYTLTPPTISEGINTITVTYMGVSTAFYVTGTAPKTVTSISATYTGGELDEGTATYGMQNLSVVATYSDGTTGDVTGYTLSPETIVSGENIITVSYRGKTTTFNVIGNSVGYNWTVGRLGANGIIDSSQTDYVVSDFIEIPSNKKCYYTSVFKESSNPLYAYANYDVNGDFVGMISAGGTMIEQISDSAYVWKKDFNVSGKVRITCLREYVDKIYIVNRYAEQEVFFDGSQHPVV